MSDAIQNLQWIIRLSLINIVDLPQCLSYLRRMMIVMRYRNHLLQGKSITSIGPARGYCR